MSLFGLRDRDGANSHIQQQECNNNKRTNRLHDGQQSNRNSNSNNQVENVEKGKEEEKERFTFPLVASSTHIQPVASTCSLFFNQFRCSGFNFPFISLRIANCDVSYPRLPAAVGGRRQTLNLPFSHYEKWEDITSKHRDGIFIQLHTLFPSSCDPSLSLSLSLRFVIKICCWITTTS